MERNIPTQPDTVASAHRACMSIKYYIYDTLYDHLIMLCQYDPWSKFIKQNRLAPSRILNYVTIKI